MEKSAHSIIKRVAFIGNYLPSHANAGSRRLPLTSASPLQEGHKQILEARLGGWWDANKIGLSPPPIETPQGWLVIYHGVKQNAADCIYRLSLALFDLNDSERCLKRGDEWVFSPKESYEQHGDVDKVIFPCGCTLIVGRRHLTNLLRRS